MVKRGIQFDFDGGIEITHEYPNGYVASVSCTRGTYGGSKGYFELAVMKDGEVCTDTPITGDVLGWLDFAGVAKALEKIEALPKSE